MNDLFSQAVHEVHRRVQIVSDGLGIRRGLRVLKQGDKTVQGIYLRAALHGFKDPLQKSVLLLPGFQIGIVGKLPLPVKVPVYRRNDRVAVRAVLALVPADELAPRLAALRRIEPHTQGGLEKPAHTCPSSFHCASRSYPLAVAQISSLIVTRSGS